MAKINGKEALLVSRIVNKTEETRTVRYTTNGQKTLEPHEGKTMQMAIITIAIPEYNGETGDITVEGGANGE